MSAVTVKQLASMVGIPVARLLTQLNDAGIQAGDENASVTEGEKMQLLSYLRRSHGKDEATSGTTPNRITLKRKSVSELRQPITGAVRPGGQRPLNPSRPSNTPKVVNVEVRRKRTFVKRSEYQEDTAKIQEAELARQALNEQAEQQRRQEEETKTLRIAQEAHTKVIEGAQMVTEAPSQAHEKSTYVERLDPESTQAPQQAIVVEQVTHTVETSHSSLEQEHHGREVAAEIAPPSERTATKSHDGSNNFERRRERTDAKGRHDGGDTRRRAEGAGTQPRTNEGSGRRTEGVGSQTRSHDGGEIRKRPEGGNSQTRPHDGGEVRKRTEGGNIQARPHDGGEVRRRTEGGNIQARPHDGGEPRRRTEGSGAHTRPNEGGEPRRRTDDNSTQTRPSVGNDARRREGTGAQQRPSAGGEVRRRTEGTTGQPHSGNAAGEA